MNRHGLRIGALCSGFWLLCALFPHRGLMLDATAQSPKNASSYGSYVNPVMPADVSDLDAIRLGSDFYAITSTFQYSPGMAVLHSRDLVHWAIVSHVVEDVSTISPEMGWDKMERAGRGIWAGSIRYHAGRFYVYFGTPDEGILMSSATRVTGPWTPVRKVISEPGWDDPCPFWDDDGRVYLVATRYKPDPDSGIPYDIHLFQMNASGDSINPASDIVIHQSRGSEANKLYKIHGLYFHFFSEVGSEGRVPMMERASSLKGPWETRQLMHVNRWVDKEPNQGGFVELQDGRWYFVTHQGTGDWEGRAGVLLPVTWVSGWPVPGDVGEDGIGNMLWTAAAPLPQVGGAGLVASDDFSEHQLKPQWEWDYQPRPGTWSLEQKPAALRLQAYPLLHAGDFRTAPNVVTQRAIRTADNVVTAKLSLAGMADGQHVGMAHFAKTDAEIEVLQESGLRRLNFVRGGDATQGPTIIGTVLWLRSRWGSDGQSQFSYSEDGTHFTLIGDSYPLTWAHYRGDRIALFTFNNAERKGYVDVLSFQYDFTKPVENKPVH
jgi:beta-xylosidase